MFYTVYKVTNQVNGKIYIGCHKTKDLDDDYMGSGKYLARAKEKHGIENFNKEILFVFDNPKEMFEKEAELVNEDFLAEANTYNLKVGGAGGFDLINSDKDLLTERNRRIAEKRDYRDPVFIEKMRQQYLLNPISPKRRNPPNTKGFKFSDESKMKMSESSTGERNSQYGSFWVTDGSSNRKLKSGDSIPENWYRGRV